MKKIALLASLVVVSAAQAQSGNFSGFYGGAQVGINDSEARGASNLNKQSVYPGFVAGHNTHSQGVVVGAEVFANFHKKSATQNDLGLTFKVGKVVNNVLVYGRAGVVGRSPGYRPQVGVGAEYKLQKNISVSAVLTHDHDTTNGTRYKNNNLAVGVNYYLD